MLSSSQKNVTLSLFMNLFNREIKVPIFNKIEVFKYLFIPE